MLGKLTGFMAAIVALLISAVSVSAHHGFGVEFDSTRCMDMKGTLAGIDWENPHAYVHMDVKEASGKVVSWTLETISPNSMKRSGTTKEDFLNGVGKPVAVRVCPTKPGGTKYRGEVEILEMTDGIPRVLGQNVENLNADQVRQHLGEFETK
jgi:hypothetical protein